MIKNEYKRRILDAMLRDIEGIDKGVVEKFITAKNRLEDLLDSADSLDSLVLQNMVFAPYVYHIKNELHVQTEETISTLLNMDWQSQLIRRTSDGGLSDD